MPTVDGATRVKHVTTHTVSAEMLELWKAFPGVRAIALHLRGARSERPHYHIWMEFEEPITNEKVKDRLRDYNIKFAKPFCDWKFTLGNEGQSHFVTWSSYVMNASKGARVLYETPDDTHPKLPEIPVLPVGGAGGAAVAAAPTVVRAPSNRAPQRVRFVAYLKTKGWEEGCIKNWNMYEKLDELTEELTDWAENAFTTPNGAVVVQHALWVYGDEIVRNMIKQKNKDYLKKSFRLFSPELS